ncbi:very short patch repair endonuclease [Xanthomonas campestris pv. campestris]|nr:very short patch repair endonuclease [Xanthomonas arboricola]MEB1941278.1 very short patch repair endonuclease [Xanthomonas campestris pv. campestris]
MRKDPVAVRSANMARIRGSNTKPELVLRRLLWSRGLRYRLGLRIEGARPDLVFPAQQLLVFVDGCFWHGCTHHYVRPRSREAFWAEKLADNTARDRRQTGALLLAGWHVLRLWEHEINLNPFAAAERVIQCLSETARIFGPRPVVINVSQASHDSTQEIWSIEDLLDPNVKHVEWRSRKPARASLVSSERLRNDE